MIFLNFFFLFKKGAKPLNFSLVAWYFKGVQHFLFTLSLPGKGPTTSPKRVHPICNHGAYNVRPFLQHVEAAGRACETTHERFYGVVARPATKNGSGESENAQFGDQ